MVAMNFFFALGGIDDWDWFFDQCLIVELPRVNRGWNGNPCRIKVGRIGIGSISF